MIIHSFLLIIELAIYFCFAITIGLHLREHHEPTMPFMPIVNIWKHLSNKNVNIVGKILAEIFAVFFTARYAIIGLLGLGIYYCHKGLKNLFYLIFTKR